MSKRSVCHRRLLKLIVSRHLEFSKSAISHISAVHVHKFRFSFESAVIKNHFFSYFGNWILRFILYITFAHLWWLHLHILVHVLRSIHPFASVLSLNQFIIWKLRSDSSVSDFYFSVDAEICMPQWMAVVIITTLSKHTFHNNEIKYAWSAHNEITYSHISKSKLKWIKATNWCATIKLYIYIDDWKKKKCWFADRNLY